MNKKKNLIFLLISILLFNCSFDDKTGIWSGQGDEKRRISDLEKQQKQIIDTEKIYLSENVYSKEIILEKKIILSKPKNAEPFTISIMSSSSAPLSFTGLFKV